MNSEKFEQDMLESREGHDQLHWYITAFAGAVLTLLFNFIKDASPVNNLFAVFCLRTSIWFLVVVIIFSPFRNYLSYDITSLFAQSERDWSDNIKQAVKYYNRAATLTRVRRIVSYISIILCITVLILLALAVNSMYLS
jgi:hypothetical protein